MRRAADELPTAELPAPLRPFARWHPERLLAERPRQVIARSLAEDARLRAALLTALEEDGDDAAPLEQLRSRHGDARTAALLTATGRFQDLAVLGAMTSDRLAAQRQAAAETTARSAVADARQQVRRLYAEISALREERDRLRRRVDAQTKVAEAARGEAQRAQAAHEEALQRVVELEAQLADERRRRERRAARVRNRLEAAEARARVDEGRTLEVARRLSSLSEELHAAIRPADQGDRRAQTGQERPSPAAAGPVVPRGVGPATPGRPCRLPAGIAGDTPDAVRALLQVPTLQLVVDGYNVTKDARGRPAAALEDQRRWLLQLLAGVHARFGCRVTVVFDGTEPLRVSTPTPRGVIVDYSRGEQIADERIVEIVAGLADDVCVLVVTSDREVREDVDALGADVATSGAFLAAVEA